MKALLTLVVLFISTIGFSTDSTVQIKAAAERNESTVGKSIDFKITIIGDYNSYNIITPENKKFAETAEGETEKPENKVPIYIVENINKEEKSEEGISYVIFTMTVNYLRTGNYKMPPIQVLDTADIEIGYNIPEVKILPVNTDGQFVEIEEPIDLYGNWSRIIIVLAILIIVIGLIIFLVRRYIKNKKNKSTMLEYIPPITIFNNDINNLKNEMLIENDELEEYIIKLSNIFRKFINLSLNILANDMTNEEIIAAIQTHSVIGSDAVIINAELRKILSLWDLAKFAEFMPGKDTLEMNLKELTEFVNKVTWENGNVRF